MQNNNVSIRLDWVDALKGGSAIIVVLNHIMCTLDGADYYENYKPPIIHNLFDGNFAVHTFIILSTVLICHGLELHRDNILQRYHYLVAKRYFRILIPVGTVILIMYISNLLGLFYAEEYGLKTNNGWLLGQYVEFKDLFGAVFGAPLGKCYRILNVGWMLGYIFFATFWVILLDILTMNKRPVKKLVLLSFCLYIALRIDFYYINVVVGYILYMIFPKIHGHEFKKIRLFCIVLAFFMFVVSDFYKYTPMWNMFRAICFVVIVSFSSKISSFISKKPLVYLGKISLSIYILQLFVLYVYTCRMADVLPDTLAMKLFNYFSTLFIVIFLSRQFSIYVEPRLNSITNRITDKL